LAIVLESGPLLFQDGQSSVRSKVLDSFNSVLAQQRSLQVVGYRLH
jgi:hypothetical protein